MRKNILTDTLIQALSVVSGIIGVVLTLIGLGFQHLFPWITFGRWWRLPELGINPWKWSYYHISPFFVEFRLEDGVSKYQWFYKIDTTLTGVACFIGAVIGLIGLFARSRKVNLAGGLIVMGSIIAFAICLPGLYPYIAWGSGAKLTFVGALAIMASALLGYIKDNIQKNRFLLNRLRESWQHSTN